MNLPGILAERLFEYARAASPDEACGLLVGTRGEATVDVARVVACENTAPTAERRRRFAIDPRTVIEEERAARGTGQEVVGFYHSHPEGDPVPSPVDRPFMALWPEAVWVIVGSGEGSDGGALRAWRLDPLKSPEPEEIGIIRA